MSIPKYRFLIFFALLALAGFIILLRYAQLMLGPRSPEITGQRSGFTERGAILDRNGRFLAIQIRLANISVWRPNVKDRVTLAEELAPILEMTASEILDKINEAPSDFLYLKRQVDESTMRLVNEAINENRISGVTVEPVVGRIYPERNLASQIIGFVGSENDGMGGIEYAFDKELSGSASGGKGSHVVLTIDSNVQHILERIAEKTMQETNAEAVIFLAMDPRTGDILGSASPPGFDPNDYRFSTDIQRMDRSAVWPYEPGSVFKVFSVAAMMDVGAISNSTFFTCNGSYERITNRGERIQINCLAPHGRVGPREIIIHSCNTGVAYASDRLGNGAFNELLRAYGFGEKTGAGNPGETRGLLWPLNQWSERSRSTIAMGQEIAVSALQMIQAATAIANDGEMVPPRIVSQIISADGKEVTEWKNGERHRVLRPETARAMRSYMVDVTSDIGTGWRASVKDLSLAVKTGTAQIADPTTRRYSSTDFIASCIALLPADSPSLVLYVAIIKPRGEILGGRIAAPAIREAAEALVDYLGILRGLNPQVDRSPQITLPTERLPPVYDIMPDFNGLSKRTIFPLLLRDDLHVEINGEGWVRRQTPPPGTPIDADTIIILELE